MALSLSDDLLVLDGDYILFNPKSSDDVSTTIDRRLLKEFEPLEKRKDGKV